MDDKLDVRRIFLKNLFKTFQIADVQVVMRVILDLFLEKLLVPGGGSLRAEEIFAQIVVDANDLQPFPAKYLAASEPTSPAEPVTSAILMF